MKTKSASRLWLKGINSDFVHKLFFFQWNDFVRGCKCTVTVLMDKQDKVLLCIIWFSSVIAVNLSIVLYYFNMDKH